VASTVGEAATSPIPVGPVDCHDKDLVWHQAGSIAQQQALALESDAPMRTWLARLSGAHTEERAWRIGAHGEKLVAERLISLRRRDPSWGFLHAIPVGERGSDIDHLVVGPGGVFTLNTKNHPGGRIWVGGEAAMVNGHRVPYVRNSRYEARRAGRLLSRAAGMQVAVVPLVVFVGLPDITVATAPDGVHILRARSLVDWLLRQPPVLQRPAIEAVYDVARKASTWQRRNPR
jgi:Nuclease-related domain